jgi:guanylate kinase
VGKDTVIDLWREANPTVQRVVAYTTRTPRPGETAGVDYQFVSRSQFLEIADSGGFLEHKEVYGNFYATPLAQVEELLADEKVAVLKIDVQGALTVMELRPDAISVFLLPPSHEELVRRIQGRGTEAGQVLDRRIAEAKAEMELAKRYRYQVVNDTPEHAVQRLQEIVGA